MNNKKKQKQKIKKVLSSIGRIILTLLAIAIIFFSGAYLAINNKTISRLSESQVLYLGKITGKYNKGNGQWSQNVDFDLYWDVWNALKNSYVNKSDFSEKKLFYGSLKGMVSALGDPYTEFMDPQENKEFNEEMSGSFEGVGMEVGIRDEVLTIISPLEGTPAFRAGIMAGDKILEIDGNTTKRMNINEAVSRIRGPRGTEVVLTIFRENLEKTLEFKIIRETIIVKSVTHKVLDGNIHLVKISSFNNDTQRLFLEVVNNIYSSNPAGLIIDLRNNPGGYLETPVALLGEWIDGKIAVIEKFGDGRIINYTAKGLNRLTDYPTVVLINSGSASASEIMTGALQYHGKAIVVGERSYGKGSVQMLKPLKDGSSLKITMAEWLTPSGKNINEEGITPDQEVELNYDDYKNNKDPQLKSALELLK